MTSIRANARPAIHIFRSFMDKMNRATASGSPTSSSWKAPTVKRGAAEFTVNGEYLATDEGLPEAKGQKYVLPAGAFEIRDGKVARISNYHNLNDWIA